MKQLRVLMLRLAGLFSNEQQEREHAEEIESHLQMHVEDNLRSGMTPEQARRDAILRLGGMESTKSWDVSLDSSPPKSVPSLREWPGWASVEICGECGRKARPERQMTSQRLIGDHQSTNRGKLASCASV